MDYHIYHFFPKLLNLYGDRGNILSLSFFARELGLNPIVHLVDEAKDIDFNKADFVLIGGGSDREQAIVAQLLLDIKDDFTKAIDDGLPCLAVCGGYQFLGNYYQDSDGNKMEGVAIFDMVTIGQKKERILGNIVVESPEFGKIVGFVNHSGETFHNYNTLGDALNNYGNTLLTKQEGLRYKNVLATYMHGPLLPKNPEITLFFLKLFAQKNNLELDYSKLDLSFENKAREIMIKRIQTSSKK